QIRILEWRFSKIIRIEGFAEVHVGPVTEPFDVASADARHFVTIWIGNEQTGRKNRAVRPAYGPDAIRIAHSFRDQIINAGVDVRRFEVVVMPAADRLNPFQSVVVAAVIVGTQDERAALRE